MSDRNDSYLQIGFHQSTNDWDDVTGTKKFLRTMGKPNLHGLKYERLPLDLQTADGSKVADLQGALMLDTVPDLPFPATGLSGGGAGDGVLTSALSNEFEELLDMLFGATATETQGDTTDGVDAGTGTTVNMDGTIATTGANRAYLIRGTNSNRLMPRFQESSAGVAATVCRALTNAGVADTALEAQVAPGGKVWNIATAAANRTHAFIDVEAANRRDIIKGVMFSTLTFQISARQLLQLVFGGGRFSDALPNTSQADPTYSAPTTGSKVKVWNSPFWIGSAEYMAKNPTFVVTLTLEERASEGGAAGVYGYMVTGVDVALSASIHRGTLNMQAADSLVDTLQGEATQDLLLALGNTAGAAYAIRIPAADCDAAVVPDGGKTAVQLTAKGTGATPAHVAQF